MTLVVASAARPVSAERGPSPSECAVDGTCCFVTKPAAARWKPLGIDITFDRITVGDTGLERTQVRRALRRQAEPIEACFERDAAIDVVFVISPAGSAQHVAVATTAPNRSKCLVGALARIAFPVSDAVTEVAVTIQLRRRP